MTEENATEIRAVGEVLVEQHGDFFRQAMAWALREVMEAEVQAKCGGGYRERTAGRTNRRKRGSGA